MVGCAMQTVRFLFESKPLPVSRATLGIQQINHAEPGPEHQDTRPTPHAGVLQAAGGLQASVAGGTDAPGRGDQWSPTPVRGRSQLPRREGLLGSLWH